MIAIKKDFVNEETESYCGKGRKLSSGKAYYLRDANGVIHFGGRQCAELHAANDLSQIPDLTKSLIARHEGQPNGGKNISLRDNQQHDLEKPKAIAYLLLREEKLSEFRFKNRPLSYEVLKNYYFEYKDSLDLTSKAVSHILNIERKSMTVNKRYSLKNLSTCYAYKYILERTLDALIKNENQKGIKYVNDLINGEKGIMQFCSLTEEQITGLSKWLQFLPQDLREARLRKFDL